MTTSIERRITLLQKEIESLKEKLQDAEIIGMQKAAKICLENQADWSYDLILNEVDRLERENA